MRDNKNRRITAIENRLKMLKRRIESLPLYSLQALLLAEEFRRRKTELLRLQGEVIPCGRRP